MRNLLFILPPFLADVRQPQPAIAPFHQQRRGKAGGAHPAEHCAWAVSREYISAVSLSRPAHRTSSTSVRTDCALCTVSIPSTASIGAADLDRHPRPPPNLVPSPLSPPIDPNAQLRPLSTPFPTLTPSQTRHRRLRAHTRPLFGIPVQDRRLMPTRGYSTPPLSLYDVSVAGPLQNGPPPPPHHNGARTIQDVHCSTSCAAFALQRRAAGPSLSGTPASYPRLDLANAAS